MKRLLVLVTVLVPLSLFVAGCGGTGGSSPTKPKTEDEKRQMMEQMKKGMAPKGMMPGMQGGTAGEAAKPGEAAK
jgi:hypothetical protein